MAKKLFLISKFKILLWFLFCNIKRSDPSNLWPVYVQIWRLNDQITIGGATTHHDMVPFIPKVPQLFGPCGAPFVPYNTRAGPWRGPFCSIKPQTFDSIFGGPLDSCAHLDSLISSSLSLSFSQLFERSIKSCKLLSSTIIPSFPPPSIITLCSHPSNLSLSAHPSPSHTVISTASTCSHISQSLGNHVRAMPVPSTCMCFSRRIGLTVFATTLSWQDCSKLVVLTSSCLFYSCLYRIDSTLWGSFFFRFLFWLL